MSGRRISGLSGLAMSVLGWAVCAYAILHAAVALGLCAWRTRHRRARLEPLTPGERWVHLGLGLVALALMLGIILWYVLAG